MPKCPGRGSKGQSVTRVPVDTLSRDGADGISHDPLKQSSQTRCLPVSEASKAPHRSLRALSYPKTCLMDCIVPWSLHTRIRATVISKFLSSSSSPPVN